jgi:hypothetical protein
VSARWGLVSYGVIRRRVITPVIVNGVGLSGVGMAERRCDHGNFARGLAEIPATGSWATGFELVKQMSRGGRNKSTTTTSTGRRRKKKT